MARIDDDRLIGQVTIAVRREFAFGLRCLRPCAVRDKRLNIDPSRIDSDLTGGRACRPEADLLFQFLEVPGSPSEVLERSVGFDRDGIAVDAHALDPHFGTPDGREARISHERIAQLPHAKRFRTN